MSRIKGSFFACLLIATMAVLSAGCKKEKENNTPADPIPEPKTATMTVAVSGDFTATMSLSNAANASAGITGLFESSINKLSILAVLQSGDDVQTCTIIGMMAPLQPGIYSLGGLSVGASTYSNTALFAGSFTVSSGILNITNVEVAPSGIFGPLQGRYVTGSVTMEMTNSASENITLTADFVNVGVVLN